MCHNPATMAFGDHNDMKRAIELLDEVKESIINAYELKTGLPRKDISKLMENETWMNARKAIELGFADGMLTDEKKEVNAAAFAFSSKAVENALLNKLAAKYDREPDTQTVPVNDTQSTVPANHVRTAEPQPVSVQAPPAQPPQPEPEQPKTQPQRGRSVDELMGRLRLIQH